MLSIRIAIVIVLLLPASASAASNLGVSIMDDQLLLNEQSPSVLDRHMRQFRSLGVDRLRVSAFWDQIAPKPGRRRKPNFDAAYSGAGTKYHFANLDRVVRAAVHNGLKLMISITTPAPLWATGDPSRHDRVWKPKTGEFAMLLSAGWTNPVVAILFCPSGPAR